MLEKLENKLEEVSNENIKLSKTERISYGMGDFATGITWNVMSMFLVFFYTDVIGISAAIIGTIIFFSRIFDGVTDIGMGIIVDRTKSKHGKARPWILWMAIPYAICGVLLFSVPDASLTIQIVYIAITYNLLALAYTAVNIPYGVVNSLMTRNQYERSLLSIIRMVFGVGAGVLVGYIIQPLVQAFGGGQIGWVWTMALLGVIGSIFLFLCFRHTEERVKPAIKKMEKRDVPIKLGVKFLFRNKYWLLVLCLFLNAYMMNGLTGGLNVYYAKWILNNEGLVGLMTLASLGPMLIGLFGLAPFIKRFGKRNTVLVGSILQIFGGLILIIDPHSVILLIISSVIKAVGGATLAGTLFAFLADTIEYGEWKNGVRTEGLVYSAGSFGSKVGTGLGAAAMGWLLTAANYNGIAATQSSDALNMIIILFVFAPIVFGLIQIIIMWFYKLDKEFPTILQDLEAIKQNELR